MESSARLSMTLALLALLTAAAEESMLRDPARAHHLTASVGGHVAFNCYLDFPFGIEHLYELYWKKDDQVIYSYANNQVMSADTYAGRITWLSTGKDGWGRGSINLTAIRETDHGWYQCSVVFPNRMPTTRNNGTFFHLEVDGGNLIATPPVNSSVMEGNVTKLDCVSKQPGSFVKWYKDDDAVGDLPDLSHRSELLNDGSMLIDPTVMSDMGWYECEIANSKGDRQSARAYLNVTYKAKVIYAPPKMYLPYGQSALLDCHYRANPPLTNLRWEKDGFLFDSYNVRGVFYRKNGSLYFDRVDESHKGRYTCTPFNSLGTEGPSPLIQVYVQHPPKFSRVPLPLQLTRAGSTVHLACDAHEPESGHVPRLQWSRQDKTPLPEGRYFIQGGNLSIESVAASDAGVYECAASNQAAKVTATSELVVEDAAPRAPHNLTADVTDTSVLVRWIPGYSRPYMEYNVWYRPVEVSEWRTMRILSKKTSEATISQLSPAREYEIMVLCEDKFGDGMFSKAIRVKTKSADGDGDGASDHEANEYTQMLGAPRDVGVRAIAGGAWMVTWSPPASGQHLLRVYVVRWHREHDEYLLGSAETINHHLLVHDLDEDQTYSFQVFSMSKQDYQTASAKVSFHVPASTRTAELVAAGCLAVLLAICLPAIYYARKCMCALCCSNGGRSGNKHADTITRSRV